MVLLMGCELSFLNLIQCRAFSDESMSRCACQVLQKMTFPPAHKFCDPPSLKTMGTLCTFENLRKQYARRDLSFQGHSTLNDYPNSSYLFSGYEEVTGMYEMVCIFCYYRTITEIDTVMSDPDQPLAPEILTRAYTIRRLCA